MKYKLQAFDILEFGQRKDSLGNPHQEDCLFPKKGLSNSDDRLFIVCDGMGGHDAGEVASATVCDAMSNFLLSSIRDPEGDFTDQTLVSAVEAAFTALNLKDTGAARKMGTTMAMLKLHSKGCTIAHMGDSRVYQIRPGRTKDDTKVVFVTEDHSLVSELVKSGQITKEEARVHPKKNVITRALQPNMERYPKVDVYHSSDIRPGDYFYLCTDGMLENMDDEQLCYFFSATAGDDHEKINKLIRAIVSNKDNHSAIMVHILDVINPIGAEAVSRKTISLSVTPECHYDSNGLTNNRLPSSGLAQQEKTGVVIDDEATMISATSKLPSNQYAASLGAQTNPGVSADSTSSAGAVGLEIGNGSQQNHIETIEAGNVVSEVASDPKPESSTAPIETASSANNTTSSRGVSSKDTLAESFKKGYESGRKKGWMGLVTVVVILLIGAFFLMQNCSGANPVTESVPPSTEKVEDSKVHPQKDNRDNNDNHHLGTRETDSSLPATEASSELTVASENTSVSAAETDPTKATIGEAVEHVNQNITTPEGKLKEELTDIVNQSVPQSQSQSK